MQFWFKKYGLREMKKCDGCEYIQGGEEQFLEFHVKSVNVYGTVALDIRTKQNQLPIRYNQMILIDFFFKC